MNRLLTGPAGALSTYIANSQIENFYESLEDGKKLIEAADFRDEIEAYHNDTQDPNMSGVAKTGKAVRHTGDWAADTASGLIDLIVPNNLIDPLLEGAEHLAGKAVGAVADVVSPAINAIASSPTGQMVKREVDAKTEQILRDYPEAADYAQIAKDFGKGGTDIAGAFGILKLLRGKWLNVFAGNTNTKLEGFYGGGKVGKILATAGVMPTAARRTIKQYFSPREIEALRQTGIPLGTYEQTLNHLHLVHKGIDATNLKSARASKKRLNLKVQDDFKAHAAAKDDPKLQAKIMKRINQNKKKITGFNQSIDKLLYSVGHDNQQAEKIEAMIAAGKEAASYQGGIESYQMLLNMQIGNNAEMAKLLFGPQAMAASKVSQGGMDDVWDFAVKNSAGEMPESVKNIMSKHVQEAWGISDKNWKNTHIVVKNPLDQHKTMGSEITNRNPTSQFMKSLAANFTPEQLSNPEIMKDVFKLFGRGNFFDDRGFVEKTKDKLFGKPPSAYADTSDLMKEYVKVVLNGDVKANNVHTKKLKAILNPKPTKAGWTEETAKTVKPKEYTNGVKYDAETGNFTFSASHGSSAKELGGVNVVTVYNVKTGDFWQQLSDEHDMLGQKPIDGDNLITTMPPVGANVNKIRKGDKEQVGYRNTAEYQQPIKDASEEIEAHMGVPLLEPKQNQLGMGMSAEQMQRAEAVAKTRNYSPTLESYLFSAGRGAQTASMFNVMSQRREEENQR